MRLFSVRVIEFVHSGFPVTLPCLAIALLSLGVGGCLST